MLNLLLWPHSQRSLPSPIKSSKVINANITFFPTAGGMQSSLGIKSNVITLMIVLGPMCVSLLVALKHVNLHQDINWGRAVSYFSLQLSCYGAG